MKYVVAFVLILLASGYSQADENWTAEVGKITVLEDGSGYIVVTNPRNGPTGSMSCTQNVVYLGVQNTPVNKALLSQAMEVYMLKKTIRFGVRGSGNFCEITYITAE